MLNAVHRRAPGRLWQSGFTLLEVSVALAIVGLLVAFVLPAILGSRESAHRVQCQANLHQIGIALTSHLIDKRRFPSAGDLFADFGPLDVKLRRRAHAPHVYLLPYLDRDELYRSLNKTLFTDRDVVIVPGFNDQNQEVIKTAIPVFRCPSDGMSALRPANNYRANVATAGESYVPQPLQRPASAFSPIYRFPLPQHFRDGLSQTIGFSERLIGDGTGDRFDPHREFFDLREVADPHMIRDDPNSDEPFVQACSSLRNQRPAHESCSGQHWFFGGYTDTWYNHALTPNHSVPDCGYVSGLTGFGVFTARSNHPGGVNAMFMDGHVRFMADQVDLQVWRAIGTRDGREAVSLDSL